MTYSIKPMSFDPQKIKGLSEKLLVSHYENNYSGAVKRLNAITRDFSSIDRWRTEFVAMGKAEGGGSGWVLLTWSPHDKRLINTWAADHTTTLAGGQPILVLDMYEHAYHMDYGAKAGDYVEAFMQVINWENVAKLHARYSSET